MFKRNQMLKPNVDIIKIKSRPGLCLRAERREGARPPCCLHSLALGLSHPPETRGFPGAGASDGVGGGEDRQM